MPEWDVGLWYYLPLGGEALGFRLGWRTRKHGGRARGGETHKPIFFKGRREILPPSYNINIFRFSQS